MNAQGRSQAFIPQRVARRVSYVIAPGRSQALIPQRVARRVVP
jgi:hypothetical protein